jgi:hypothetical protein
VDIIQKADTMSRMAKTDGRRARRKFSEEFQTGVVRLVLDEGKTAPTRP